MRCNYCAENIAGQPNIVIVNGEGPAHRVCFEREQFSAGMFFGIDLGHMDDTQLGELFELVKVELNARTYSQEEAIELF